MIRHIVLFKFLEEIDNDSRSETLQQLVSLLSETPFAQNTTVNKSLGLLANLDRSADLECGLEFATVDDFDSYVASEIHQRFLSDNLSKFIQMLAIQVELQASERRLE